MANLTILRTYALQDPTTLPTSVLFSHSDKTSTIYDVYPKSIFHFLVLPRVLSSSKSNNNESEVEEHEHEDPKQTTSNPSISDLSNLQTLLNSKNVNKEQAKAIILTMKDEAERVKKEIQEEMEKKYGFVWDIWIGFHGTPSMTHTHLHVLSADLCSVKMKNKKHYNSFHPKLGFFLHIDEVLSWFDAEESYYKNMVKLSPAKYEPILKEPLSCFHCNVEMKNIPTLKTHLQEEWEKLQTRAEKGKKRKLEVESKKGGGESIPTTNAHTSTDGEEKSPARKKTKQDT